MKKIPQLILTQMLGIVQDVHRKKTTMIQAARLLLNLTDDQNSLMSKLSQVLNA